MLALFPQATIEKFQNGALIECRGRTEGCVVLSVWNGDQRFERRRYGSHDSSYLICGYNPVARSGYEENRNADSGSIRNHIDEVGSKPDTGASVVDQQSRSRDAWTSCDEGDGAQSRMFIPELLAMPRLMFWNTSAPLGYTPSAITAATSSDCAAASTTAAAGGKAGVRVMLARW